MTRFVPLLLRTTRARWWPLCTTIGKESDAPGVLEPTRDDRQLHPGLLGRDDLGSVERLRASGTQQQRRDQQGGSNGMSAPWATRLLADFLPPLRSPKGSWPPMKVPSFLATSQPSTATFLPFCSLKWVTPRA